MTRLVESCYALELAEPWGSAIQSSTDKAFAGGLPCVPGHVQLPECTLCKLPLTFFFQVAFPAGFSWSGFSLAVFACSSCEDYRFVIPEMPVGELYNITLTHSFLKNYQRNFRLLVFPTSAGCLRHDYVTRIRFGKLSVVPTNDLSYQGNKLGGIPSWLTEDETPGSCEGISMAFLLQLVRNFDFPITDSATGQIHLDIDGLPRSSQEPIYKLFLGNQLYLFGTQAPAGFGIYAITQVTR